MQMRCLISIIGMSRVDKVRNKEVRRGAGVGRSLFERVDQRVLRWNGHMERMNEERLV